MPILEHLWIIPLLPLLGATVNGLLGRTWPNKIVNAVAIGATGLSFLAALEAVREFFLLRPEQIPWVQQYFTWIEGGNFRAGFDLQRLKAHVDLIASRREYIGELRLAAAVSRARCGGAIRRKRNDLLHVALATLTGAIPLIDHGANLRHMCPQHVLALSLCFGSLRELCSQLTILAIRTVDLQW